MDGNTEKERRHLLKQEMEAYEKVTPMTGKERALLREWVNDGHSVHENASMACWDGGAPVDFLDVQREEKEINEALSSMSYAEGSRYLLEKYGIDRDGILSEPEPDYEELKEKARRLYRTCMLYSDVLRENGLEKKANAYVREHIDEELPFDLFEWDLA